MGMLGVSGVCVPLSPHGIAAYVDILLCVRMWCSFYISDGSPNNKPPGAAGSPMTGKRDVSVKSCVWVRMRRM